MSWIFSIAPCACVEGRPGAQKQLMATSNSKAINQRRAERSVSDQRDEFINELPPRTRSSVYEFLDESRGDGYHADGCFKNAAEQTVLRLACSIVYEVRNKSSG